LPASIVGRKKFVWNVVNHIRRIRGGLIDLFADCRARVRFVCLWFSPAEHLRRNAAQQDPHPGPAIGPSLKKLAVTAN
jgi:hypothetical protein